MPLFSYAIICPSGRSVIIVHGLLAAVFDDVLRGLNGSFKALHQDLPLRLRGHADDPIDHLRTAAGRGAGADLNAGKLLSPQMGDDVLEKKCKPVTKMTLRTKILIEDMLDTMYEKMGVGLAAPQVGILKQIVVIDVGEGPIVLINPEIVETSGEQTGEEGCLSVPGKWGIVTRPNYVKVRALNENMEEFEIEGEELLARAFCHEIDHLGGHLYVEKVEGELHDSPAYNEEDMEYEVEE